MDAGAGRLEFELTRKSGAGESKTAVIRAEAASPLRFFHPYRDHGPAWVYATTLGGGILGGDQIKIGARVGPGAEAVFTTQAASKVYRSPKPSAQWMEVEIGDDGLFAYVPEHTLCYRGAGYSQKQSFKLSGNASLIFCDCLSAGRTSWSGASGENPDGERWAFDKYDSLTEIVRDGKLILHERLLLDPHDGPLVARMGRFNAVLTLVLAGAKLEELSRGILESVAKRGIERSARVILSASPLARDQYSGVILRAAGADLEELEAAVRIFLTALPPLLHGNPWERKG